MGSCKGLAQGAVTEEIHPFVLEELGRSILSRLPRGVRLVSSTRLLPSRGGLCTTCLTGLERSALGRLGGSALEGGHVEVLTNLAQLHRVYYRPTLFISKCGKDSTGFRRLGEVVRRSELSKEEMLVFSRFAGVLSLVNQRLTLLSLPFFCLSKRVPSTREIRVYHQFGRKRHSFFLVSLGTNNAKLGLANTSAIVLCSL